jgi:hypothetical protein
MKLSSLISICLLGLVKAGLNLLSLKGPPPSPVTVREETCRFCYRQCPISCFVGTCGLEYGFMTKRYKFTNKCYTCDAQASVGINKNGDFSLCTAKESSATTTYIKKAKDGGPTGPGLPGDARSAAQASSDAANEAMKQAQIAAQKADEAAKAAVDSYRKVSAGTKGAGNNEQLAEAHRLAEQIRAQEASKAAEAATAARNIAEQKYNGELKKLRKQQLITDRAEEILMRAEKAGEEARAAYTQAAARAAQAARDAAMSGAVAAGQAAAQAEADEMASAARAAQRRAIMAAKSAKDAADKANIAASIAKIPPQPKPTLPPCASLLQGTSLLQGSQPQGCALPADRLQLPEPPTDGTSPYSAMAQNDAAAAVVGAMPNLPYAAVQNMPQAPDNAPPVPQYLRQMLQARGVAPNQIQAPVPVRAPRADAQYGTAPSINDASSSPEAQHPIGIDGEGLPPQPAPAAEPMEDGDAGTSGDPLLQPDGTEDTGLLPDGSADRDRISSAMADQLAEKLESNPNAVSNPQLYDMSQNPVIKTQFDASMARVNPNLGGDDHDPTLQDAEAVPQNMPPSAGGIPQLNLDPNSIPTVGDVMTQQGDVPGMLSTIQLGSSMRSWGHGRSKRV